MASGGNMTRPLAYDGEASEKDVEVGFSPRTVLVTNMTDGSQVYNDVILASHPTVAKRGGRKTDAAGAVTWLAAAAGVQLTGSGFTVGTDAACNAAGVQYHAVVTD